MVEGIFIALTFFFSIISFFLAWLYLEYKLKLDIEQHITPIASSIATVHVQPGRVVWDTGIARVTVYKDLIVIMHTSRNVGPLYHEVRDYSTGLATIVKLRTQNYGSYRFTHIIKKDNIKSLSFSDQNKTINLKYADSDKEYLITISSPKLFTAPYLKFFEEMRKFTK